MGTETKLNCYTEKSSTGVGIPKLINGSAGYTNGVSNGTGKQNGSSNGQTAATATTTVVPTFVPIHIDENNVIDGARDILKVIRPHWDLENVQFKKFTDGITNKLVGCFNEQSKSTQNANGNSSNGNGSANHASNGSSSPYDDNNDSGNISESDAETDAEVVALEAASSLPKSSDNVVLVRVYGNKTDLLIDRKAETRNILLLHAYGFAPSLYATFKNGLAYDYVPGVTLNTRLVQRPEVWRLVARRMAEMHRVVKVKDAVVGGQTVPMIWKKMQSFLDLVPERFSNADKHKRIEGTFLPISRLRDEFNMLYKQLVSLGSPLVFAHNDLLLGNIVYMESQQSVNFIDYEYADYNFQAFDIGNHFCEFAGVDEVDFARYPSREFQLEWLRVYLQSYLRRSLVTEDEVERLYVQVNQFALAAHLFWTVWSLIQAEHSTIDFDYVDYAFLRYTEYLARKDEFLALDCTATS